MPPKINREELPEIVEEAARQQADDEHAIAESEAKQILRELDLPADRLGEARQAIAARHRARTVSLRTRALGALAAVALVTGVVLLAITRHTSTAALATMTVTSAALTLHGSALPAAVARTSAPELSFDVVLANPPHAAVRLSCDWTGPDGNVHFQSRWETKPIDRDAWPTHCRRAFGTGEPAGPWSVAMKEESRVLASRPFVLE